MWQAVIVNKKLTIQILISNLKPRLLVQSHMTMFVMASVLYSVCYLGSDAMMTGVYFSNDDVTLLNLTLCCQEFLKAPIHPKISPIF